MGTITVNQDSLKARKDFKRFAIKNGSNIYRILPPFGDLELHNNYAYRKWTVVWGLVDPETGKARPFSTPWSNNEKACPVHEYVKALKDKVQKLVTSYEAKLTAKGMAKADVDSFVKEKMKPLNELIRNLSPKSKYVYNAADQAGEVGILELSVTSHDALKREMSAYICDYSQDPTSLSSDNDDSGVWFNFLREGEGFDTKYDVRKHQKKTKTEQGITYIDDRSPLAENIVENYKNLAYDIHNLYKRHTYAQMKALLDYNMERLIQSCPEAAIESFLPSSTAATKTEDETPFDVTPTPAPVKKATKPVMLAVDDDADTDSTPVAKVTASAPVTSAAVSAKKVTPSDLFAMADELLNS